MSEIENTRYIVMAEIEPFIWRVVTDLAGYKKENQAMGKQEAEELAVTMREKNRGFTYKVFRLAED